MDILSVTWKVNPEMFTLLGREIRWYGLLWVIGLLVAVYIVQRIFKKEDLPEKWFDALFIYMIVGIIVGARLGHCFFYEPSYYLAHPAKILKVWEGGLASHGGVIGIILAVWLYSRKVTRLSMLWTFDRVMVPTGFTAAMIRLGNLMNHEIYGGPTDRPWGFRFVENLSEWMQGAEPIYSVPSHPTQVYEALCYLVVFALTMFLYWRTDAKYRKGLITGTGIIIIFLFRFGIEFIKNVQVEAEYSLISQTGLNIGQWLSIPFILWGVWLIWMAVKRPAKIEITPKQSLIEKKMEKTKKKK